MPQASNSSATGSTVVGVGVKRPANYSHCPLKKRPIKYDAVDLSDDSQNGRNSVPDMDSDFSEPENLSTKPEDLRLVNSEAISSTSLNLSTAASRCTTSVQKFSNSKSDKPTQPLHIASAKATPSSSSSTTAGIHNGNSATCISQSRSSSQEHQLKICVPQSQVSASPSYVISPSLSQRYQQQQPPIPSPSFQRHLPIAPPPPLKVFSNITSTGNARPLEAISFNPQVAWPSQEQHRDSHHYMPFNFTPPTSTVSGATHIPPPPSHRHLGNLHKSHSYSLNFHPYSQLAPTYLPHNEVMGSPPHISPPLHYESSYPPVKQHQLQPHRQSTTNLYSSERVRPPLRSPKQGFSKGHNEKDMIKESTHYIVRDSDAIKREHISQNSSLLNRSRSLSSGSDRSSPIPSDSLSPCSSTGSTAAAAIIPTNVNGSIRYQCPDCSKSYSTFSGLSKHLQFHCSSQNKKSFMCKFCEKVYNSLGALKMHIRTHTLPCKCNICGKAFSRPWLLQGHIRTHTGEKPFSCEYCHRAFADRSNLRAHLQTHSEVKKYSCQSCSKTFSRTSLLAKHKDSGCGNSEAVSVFRVNP